MEAGKKDLHTHGLKLWRGKSVRPTMGKMILTVDTSVAAVYIQPLFFTSIVILKEWETYRGGDLMSIVMGFLNLHTVCDLVLDCQDPNFKKLKTFLNKLQVNVQTGPGGEWSCIKTIWD